MTASRGIRKTVSYKTEVKRLQQDVTFWKASCDRTTAALNEAGKDYTHVARKLSVAEDRATFWYRAFLLAVALAALSWIPVFV